MATILQQVHPGLDISVQGMRVMSDLVVLVLTSLLIGAKSHRQRTMTSSASSSATTDTTHQTEIELSVKDIEASVVRLLRGELVHYALNQGRLAQKTFIDGTVDIALPSYQRGEISLDSGKV